MKIKESEKIGKYLDYHGNMKEKQLYGYFKQQTEDIVHQKIVTGLQNGNLKRESACLLIAVKNNCENKKKAKRSIFRLSQEHERESETTCVDLLGTAHKILVKGLEELEIRKRVETI